MTDERFRRESMEHRFAQMLRDQEQINDRIDRRREMESWPTRTDEMVSVRVTTRHPEDYELINHADDTRWVIRDGRWHRKQSESYTEFGFTCSLCGTSERWTTDKAHQAAALWHVYRAHPDRWEQQWPGEEPGALPETLGAKVAG